MTGGGGGARDPDLVRDIVYQKLEGLTKAGIQERFLRGRGPQTITEIMSHCRDGIRGMRGGGGGGGDDDDDDDDDGYDKTMAAAATVLMHYLCTVLLIPAQRRVTVKGIGIDMAIPDTRTLSTNGDHAVVLCILESVRRPYVDARIADAKKVQPDPGNLWVISPRPVDTGHRTFVADPADCSLSGIIDAINGFLDGCGGGGGGGGGGASKLRIFGAA